MRTHSLCMEKSGSERDRARERERISEELLGSLCGALSNVYEYKLKNAYVSILNRATKQELIDDNRKLQAGERESQE